MAKKDFDGACARFEASQNLDPAPGTLFNLATCEEGRGRFATAMRRWKEGIALLPPGDDRRDDAVKSARAAQARTGSLVLRLPAGSPEGTEVTLDGRAVDPAELGGPILVDPGDHQVGVTAPGHEPVTLTTTTPGGAVTEVPLKAGPATPPTAAPLPKKPTAPPSPTSGSPAPPSFLARHKMSLSFLGAGIAVGAIGGGIAGGVSPAFSEAVARCNEAPGNCTQADFDPVKEQATIANALFGVAGAAGLTSVLLFFFAEDTFAPAPAKVSIAVGPSGGVLTLRY